MARKLQTDRVVFLDCKFDRNNIDRTKDYEGHMMVSVVAEDEKLERTPVQIMLILDVSASMNSRCESGQSKIEALKDTAKKIVHNLTEEDRITIVAFSDVAEVIVPNTLVKDKDSIKTAITGLQTVSATNMAAGILEGVEQFDDSFEGVNRMMVFTDGMANCGTTGRDLIELADNRRDKISISSFGFGQECDHELLGDLSVKCGGNYYPIKDSRDMSNVFAKELGGIISCMAQNIKVVIKPNKGSEIVEILNDYTVDSGKDDSTVVKAEDIYAGEKKHIVVKMSLKKPDKPKDRAHSVAHVEISYEDVKSKEKVTEDFNLKVRYVKANDADDEAKVGIEEQVAILEAAKAQREAVAMADAGNFDAAQQAYSKGILRMSRVSRRAGASRGLMRMYGAANDNVRQLFSAETYSAEVGTKLSADALGLSQGRAVTGDGEGLSDVLETSAQVQMMASFDEVDVDTPANSSMTVDPMQNPPNLVLGVPVQDPQDDPGKSKSEIPERKKGDTKKTWIKKRSGK